MRLAKKERCSHREIGNEKWMGDVADVAFVFSQMASPDDMPRLYSDIAMLVGDPVYLHDWLEFFR